MSDYEFVPNTNQNIYLAEPNFDSNGRASKALTLHSIVAWRVSGSSSWPIISGYPINNIPRIVFDTTSNPPNWVDIDKDVRGRGRESLLRHFEESLLEEA